LESWKKGEEKFGDAAAIASINARQPNKVKRKRKILAAEGEAQEEDEEAGNKHLDFSSILQQIILTFLMINQVKRSTTIIFSLVKKMDRT